MVTVPVAVGEAIVSLRQLSADWGWSRNRVARFFKLLISDHMVEATHEATYTRVKILNWKRLQGDDSATEPLSEPMSEPPPEPPPEPVSEPVSEPIIRSKEVKKVRSKEPGGDAAPLPPVLEALQNGLERATPSDDGPGSAFRQLFELARRQGVNAKDETLARYLRGWIKQKGGAEVGAILMNDNVVGKDVKTIQDYYFNSMKTKGFV